MGAGDSSMQYGTSAPESRNLENYVRFYFQSLLKDKNGVFIDVKGIFKDQMSELEYWSL